ncbi:MAG: N-acetyltransferase [Chitinophagaceae bacterium]|nr:N-acetyltransferase [Chitinophagaceae bacterium]
MTVLRLATPDDVDGILNIYAPYIESTSFTFETEVPTLEEFAERIRTYLINWPWLVCEVDGVIAGYAYATKYRERTAYQWCTESSIYIHDDFQRAGIARALYTALLDILKMQGFRNVYAVINLPNEKSVAFHESCGFEYFATYEKVGYKLGKWKNVGWWRLVVNEFGDDPPAPVKFSVLDKSFLPELFAENIKTIKR